MSLARSRLRFAFACLVVAALPAMSACTVTPLYSSQSSLAPGQSVTADLSSIAIDPVRTRYGQEVRNHLIFAFNGGAGQPPVPAYTLALTVTALNENTLVIEVAKQNEPSAGTMTLTGSYVLTDVVTKKPVAKGRRQISASYDVPRQEFAAVRAKRDAENRAARELADALRLAIAQDVARGSSSR